MILLSATLLACHQAADETRARASAPAIMTIEPVGPKGEVTWPFVFEWQANGAPGTLYRVTVMDMLERPLVERDTRATRLDAPRDLEILLPRTKRFLWRVAALDANGEPAARTPLIEFTVR